MVLGLLQIELRMPQNDSLKGKRMVLRSLKDRVRRNFNVSISETGGLDKWRRATLGIAQVGSSKKYVNGSLCRIMDVIKECRGVELIDYQMEID